MTDVLLKRRTFTVVNPSSSRLATIARRLDTSAQRRLCDLLTAVRSVRYLYDPVAYSENAEDTLTMV